uniref:Erythromycin biosynthesis protein CIII-like C-terminal domain-containing protein n=1 Tax=Chromera velia CCMP2878 TaxID=1169474 RepID=A0A0G4F8L9_9ALVE|mmetsp:Transcript_47934/g.94565  ORF Transcript_47934/g.94565 Transcript_47934/m.94565 type:complete len:476 (+) Transcript_47934:51-1478(+)|eukprot:Cvel_15734.t1-p1 / transcript=Cvel_15734.t1 / gene=Cvel_15734 / organism=Chromera_velia_CCMP2878 / gene_product=hypothetical protein / transcript_product=hypothetical protein / location=Cvel_scaffold1177:7581-9782(-) / protein_length=475 / sequence_SO=supercontig / SO=protein_coding / is_pseudo=false
MTVSVAVVPIPYVGHLNPFLSVVKALVKAGARVTCFGDASIEAAAVKAGAEYRFYYGSLFDPEEKNYHAALAKVKTERGLPDVPDPLKRGQVATLCIKEMAAAVAAVDPQAILFDPFCTDAAVVSRLLKIPPVSLIPYSGMGIMGDESWALGHSGTSLGEFMASEEFKRVQADMKAACRVDPFEDSLPMQHYSKGLNIVAVIEELARPLDPLRDPIAFRYNKEAYEKQIFVGGCVELDVRQNGLVDDPEEHQFLCQKIEEARKAGMRVLLASLGTVVTGAFWEAPPPGIKPGGCDSGRAFFEAVGGALVQAVGVESLVHRVFVILVCGPSPDATTVLGSLPPNVVCAKSIRQAELLTLCDAFLSHMGANSMNEALLAGKPLIPFPAFADQPTNGEAVLRNGAGSGSWEMFRSGVSASVEAVRGAVVEVLEEEGTCKKKAVELGKRIRSAGGGEAAARALLEFVARQQEQQKLEQK